MAGVGGEGSGLAQGERDDEQYDSGRVNFLEGAK